MSLLGREGVLEQLDVVLERATQGVPQVAVVNGIIGMGKTSVLDCLEERAADQRFTVLHATCTPEERDRNYSVLRQLFRDAAPPSGEPLDIGHHALTAVRHVSDQLARLTARHPALIALDDIEHADTESLLCLHLVMQSAVRLPVALVCTQDWSREAQPAHPLRALMYNPEVLWISLDPLPVAAIADLIGPQGGDGRDAAERRAAEHHARTGGNPWLVRALLSADADREFPRVLLECVRRLGGPAVSAARALAVLGEDADPRVLSRLTDSDPHTAEQARRCLSEAGVLDGLRFRHEAAATAVLADMTRGEEVRLRHRAALRMYESGKPATVIARQFLAAGPLAQDWTPPILEDAVRHTLDQNQAALSVRYLDLLGASHTEVARRRTVEARAAVVDWLRAPAESIPRLKAVKELTRDGQITGDLHWTIAELLLWNLQFEDGLDIVQRLAPEHTAGRLLLATTYPGLAARLGQPAAEVPHAHDIAAMVAWPAELRARQALMDVLTRCADKHTIAQAEQVLQDSGFSHASLVGVVPALLALAYADLLGPAAAWCDRFLNGDGSHEVTGWQALIGSVSALVSLREGHLDVAVKEAEASLADLEGPEWNESFGLTLATLAEAHTAIGSYEAAAALLARPVPAALFETRSGLHYLYARGRHHLATGRPQQALEDFLACGERMIRWRIDTPSLALWREGAAEASLALGQRRQAAELIAQPAGGCRGVDLMRSQGIRLRCQAAVHGPQERLALLEQALHTLQQSGDRYQTAQTLADLSETYRLLGDNPKARAAARRARRIAESCHADKLCHTLISAYVPSVHQAPSTAAEEGKFSKLSDSERRVAILAAQGYTNREISDKLHITVSTVEQHLTRTYRKMQIKNRDELPTDFHIDAARIR
ncbi:AAA family ATPase [Streptomyces asiaticus]